MIRVKFIFLVFLLSLAAPCLANVSEWKSSTGTTVRLYTSTAKTFRIQFTDQHGRSDYVNAAWIDPAKSFQYQARDGVHYGYYTSQGSSIEIRFNDQIVAMWNFTRWLR